MARRKAEREPASAPVGTEYLQGDPGDEQPAPAAGPKRRAWHVRMGEYPRIVVEAVDPVGAALAYRLELGIRRLDLPVETVELEG